MNTEQSIRYNNLLYMALDAVKWGQIDRAEDYTTQALALIRIEIKAAGKVGII